MMNPGMCVLLPLRYPVVLMLSDCCWLSAVVSTVVTFVAVPPTVFCAYGELLDLTLLLVQCQLHIQL